MFKLAISNFYVFIIAVSDLDLYPIRRIWKTETESFVLFV
jgi:hypothetical protein